MTDGILKDHLAHNIPPNLFYLTDLDVKFKNYIIPFLIAHEFTDFYNPEDLKHCNFKIAFVSNLENGRRAIRIVILQSKSSCNLLEFNIIFMNPQKRIDDQLNQDDIKIFLTYNEL